MDQVPQTGSASLSDLLTAVKNLVIAVNNLAQTYKSVNGISTAEAIGAATLVSAVPGRVASVSVTTTGATGMLYDSSQLGVTTAPLYVIPAAVGVYVVNLPTNSGLLVVPGSGQVVTVSWS